jgi:hypothetical protein
MRNFRGLGMLRVRQILNVIESSPGHFFWPELDVDLDVESIEHPERFPLKSKFSIRKD